MERLDDYLSRADVVAAALPDTEATRGLFTAERFAAMKKGVYFINAGRGNAVDQDALCEALASGQIGGAALDVTEPECCRGDIACGKQRDCILRRTFQAAFI